MFSLKRPFQAEIKTIICLRFRVQLIICLSINCIRLFLYVEIWIRTVYVKSVPLRRNEGILFCCGLFVGWSVNQQFSVISFAEVAKVKFIIQIFVRISSWSWILGVIQQFSTDLCPVDLKKSNYFSFLSFFLQRLHLMKNKMLCRFIIKKWRNLILKPFGFDMSYLIDAFRIVRPDPVNDHHWFKV